MPGILLSDLTPTDTTKAIVLDEIEATGAKGIFLGTDDPATTDCCCGEGCWYPTMLCPGEPGPALPYFIPCDHIKRPPCVFQAELTKCYIPILVPVNELPPDAIVITPLCLPGCDVCGGPCICTTFCQGNPPPAFECPNMLQVSISSITAAQFCEDQQDLFLCDVTNRSLAFMMVRENPFTSPCNYRILEPGQEYGSTDFGCCATALEGTELSCVGDQWVLVVFMSMAAFNSTPQINACIPPDINGACEASDCFEMSMLFRSPPGSGCVCPDEVVYNYVPGGACIDEGSPPSASVG